VPESALWVLADVACASPLHAESEDAAVLVDVPRRLLIERRVGEPHLPHAHRTHEVETARPIVCRRTRPPLGGEYRKRREAAARHERLVSETIRVIRVTGRRGDCRVPMASGGEV